MARRVFSRKIIAQSRASPLCVSARHLFSHSFRHDPVTPSHTSLPLFIPKLSSAQSPSEIGYGIVANKPIPRGTITWALDNLDQHFAG